MRRLTLLAGFLTAALLLVLWWSGSFEAIEAMAKTAQREFQNALAAPLRRLKSGDGGAILVLLAVAFAYGVAHAAGPGHGKVLLGGYALGTRSGTAKLILLSLAASLAQATFAVFLVYSGVLIFGWGRDHLKSMAEDWFAPLSALTIAALGVWIAVRGLKHLRRATAVVMPLAARRPFQQAHGHHDHADHPQDHHHDHACGHAHGPSLEDVTAVHDWRAAAALIGGIAIRPCTGALFLLILTWQMGIAGAGIAGTYAMGLGTAIITIAASLGAVMLREGMIAGLARSRALSLALPILEITAGVLIAVIAATMAYAPL